jgi:hypothetical protein
MSERNFFTEKSEELRSRLALAYSLIRTYDEILLNTYNSFVTKEEVPPFIYPRGQIENMKQHLETLIKEIDEMKIEVDLDEDIFDAYVLAFAVKMGELESRSWNILISSLELLSVLEQRILRLEVTDKLKSNGYPEYKFADSTRILEAIDALTYDFFKKTLGTNWIKDKRFAPFSIFSEKDYSINVETLLVRIPYYDCFRSKFWAIISHNVAHIFVYHHHSEIQNEEFTDLLERNLLKLAPILREPTDVPNLMSQVTELICDAVSCFVCGPPAFLSLCTSEMLTLSRVFINNHYFGIGQMSHPPLFFRYLLMKRTLEHTGIFEVDKGLLESISSIENATRFDAKHALEKYSVDCTSNLFAKYIEFVEEISKDILSLLDYLAEQNKIGCFGGHEFRKLVESLRTMNLENLTPTEAINTAWFFHRNGRREEEIFQTVVSSCCDYFEKIVFPETKKYIYRGE